MAYGMGKCKQCDNWISKEQMSTHKCVTKYIKTTEKINYLHSLFQEMEDQNINLPMGNYNLVYDILEDIRFDFELENLFNGNF